MTPKLKTSLLALTTAMALSTAHLIAAPLLDWQFNDANGTGLTTLAQSGTFGSGFATAVAGMTTNGAGGLLIKNNGTTAPQSWLDGTINLTSGLYQMDALISSYDLTNLTGGSATTAGSGLYIGFINSDNGIDVTADFNLTANATNVFLQGRTAPSGTLAQQGSVTLAKTGTALAVRLLVDFDTNNAELLYSAGNTGTYTSVFIASMGTRDGVDFRLRQSANITGGSDNIVLDSITVTAIPEPGTLALVGLSGVAILMGLRRRRG
jgi:hypothetical protein